MSQTAFQDEHARGNVRVYSDKGPYSVLAVYEIHPIGTAPVALQCLETVYSGHPNTSSLYASRWIPVINQITTSSAPVPPSSAQSPSLPLLPPPPPSSSHTSADDRRSGTQGERDLIQLEQKIISSQWYASNTLEPTCGSADCPDAADYYGIRGMSCYTAFVVPNLDGSFGCWWEGCSAYAARRLEEGVKHQRSNHFNHKPFPCVPTNATACGKRFFSLKDLQGHRHRCH